MSHAFKIAEKPLDIGVSAIFVYVQTDMFDTLSSRQKSA